MLGVVVSLSFTGVPSLPTSRSDRKEDRPRESVWRSESDTAEYLVLLGFPSEGAAQDDLRQLLESEEPISEAVNPPTEVHQVAIEDERGQVLDEVPIGAYMAVTRSMASPGYGEESRERLRDMLATFAQVEGYRGHLLGHNESMKEEGRSFVFGTNRAKLPVPENSEVDVRLYQRLS